MQHGKDNPPDPDQKSPLFEALDDLDEAMKEAREKAKPGATGRFPEGKLNPTDEGEIKFLIGHNRDKVFVNFGKLVAWIAMDPGKATELAKTIRKHAKKAQRYSSMD